MFSVYMYMYIFVTMLAAAYFVYTPVCKKNEVSLGSLRKFQGLYHVAFAEIALSKVLVSFTDHHCFPHFLTSSQWTKRDSNCQPD